MKKTKDDAYMSSQLKLPKSSSRGEPLVDIPENFVSSFSRQGLKRSSTLKQVKSQKTTMTAVENFVQSFSSKGLEKNPTLKQAKSQKTIMTAVENSMNPFLRRGLEQSSKQAKSRKTTMTAVENSVPFSSKGLEKNPTFKQAKSQKTLVTAGKNSGRSFSRQGLEQTTINGLVNNTGRVHGNLNGSIINFFNLFICFNKK